MLKCLFCPVRMVVGFDIALLRDPLLVETHQIMEIEMQDSAGDSAQGKRTFPNILTIVTLFCNNLGEKFGPAKRGITQ